MEDLYFDFEKFKEGFSELAESIGELQEALKGLADALPKRKVIIKGADVKPDVYGGYLQKKRRKKR